MDDGSTDNTMENFHLIHDTVGDQVLAMQSEKNLHEEKESLFWWPTILTPANTLVPSSRGTTPFGLIWETGKMTSFIKSDTGKLCMWLEVLSWEELVWPLIKRDLLVLSMWLMWKMSVAKSLPPNSPTFLLLAKATKQRFLFPREKLTTSSLLKRETGDWWPNTAAVSEMISRWHE